ncbi:exodeoxyribonuclease VII large subunit, partial [Tepidimonas sp.]|uniref:exodeoxyribonuclease VII large subunit n=1 Tax=Tepidimonas sp. TaxID=2002775 RepID=UPI0039189157
TAAAELSAPAATTLCEALQRQAERLSAALWRRIDAQAQHLDRLAQRLGRPSTLTARERARLQAHEHRLERALALRIDRQRQHLLRLEQAWQSAGRRDTERRRLRLERWGAQLALLDPHLVLQRGYALVTDARGHVVTRADQTARDAALHVALAVGRLDVRVSAVHAEAAR